MMAWSIRALLGLALFACVAPASPAKATATCVPFTTFPLTVNLGSVENAGDGESARCFGAKVMAAFGMMGQPNGMATLDAAGKLPSSQLSSAGAFSSLTSAQMRLGDAAAGVDPASYALSPFGVSQYLYAPGTSIPFHVQMGVGVTGATQSYEKDAIRGWCETQDPSTSTVLKDCVGVAGYGWIGSNNPNGRAWGLYGEGRARLGGGDGLVYGAELASINDGSDQPSIATPTSKYSALLTASGSVPSTSAVFITRAGAATYHHGIVADPGVFTGITGDSFIRLLGKFAVFPNGSVSVGYAPANAQAPFDVLGQSSFRSAASTGPVMLVTPSSGALAIESSFASGGYVPLQIKNGGTTRFAVNPTNASEPNPTVPASSTATCAIGDHAWDASYEYRCVAANQWKRAALSSW